MTEFSEKIYFINVYRISHLWFLYQKFGLFVMAVSLRHFRSLFDVLPSSSWL